MIRNNIGFFGVNGYTLGYPYNNMRDSDAFTGEGLFLGVARFLGVKKSDAYAVIRIAKNNWNFVAPIGWDRCLAWANMYVERLAKWFDNADLTPLKGTGMTCSIVTFKMSVASRPLMDSHAVVRIEIFTKDSIGQPIFYVDGGGLSGQRFTVPGRERSVFSDPK
jgi:hypothetical protein